MTKQKSFKFHQSILCKPKTSGFTLAELMIVVAIIGILSAIAIPLILTWLPNMHLKAAARDLFSTMQRVRMEAVKTNHDWAIVFDPPTNSYRTCSAPGADNNWATLADNTVEGTVNFTTYGSGIAYGHGNIPAGNSATTPVGAFPAGDVSYAANVLTLNSRGTGTAGYVYLENQNQDDTVFAVGTQTSGVIMIRRWMGGGTWQ